MAKPNLSTKTIRPARSLIEDRAIKAEIRAAWDAGMLTSREVAALASSVNWR